MKVTTEKGMRIKIRNVLTGLGIYREEFEWEIEMLAELFIRREQTKEAFGMMSMMKKNAHPEFMAQSQALKDATMAWNISKHQDFLTVHFNGNYHTDGGDGIINYLKGYWQGVKFKSVCSVRQEDISHLDECNIGRADFYICVPEDMVTTY